jgi:hypothetical protein
MARLRHLALLLALLAAFAPAAPALAQDSGPFAPLPQATLTPAPTEEPSNDGIDDGSTGTQTLYVIGAALLVSFVAIGMWISRDARRSIPEHHRGRHAMAEPERGLPQPRHRDPKVKQKARKKTREQRRARRHNR